MRLTVRRKARRRGQSIAVGAVSQSWPSVGWTGKVASGCMWLVWFGEIRQSVGTRDEIYTVGAGHVLGQNPAKR